MWMYDIVPCSPIVNDGQAHQLSTLTSLLVTARCSSSLHPPFSRRPDRTRCCQSPGSARTVPRIWWGGRRKFASCFQALPSPFHPERKIQCRFENRNLKAKNYEDIRQYELDLYKQYHATYAISSRWKANKRVNYEVSLSYIQTANHRWKIIFKILTFSRRRRQESNSWVPRTKLPLTIKSILNEEIGSSKKT